MMYIGIYLLIGFVLTYFSLKRNNAKALKQMQEGNVDAKTQDYIERSSRLESMAGRRATVTVYIISSLLWLPVILLRPFIKSKFE